MFKWRIGTIFFSGGQLVNMEESSVLLLIGPNSCGKSTALRNLHSAIQGSAASPVISHVSVEREGGPAEMATWFEQNYPRRTMDGASHYVTSPGAAVREDQLANHWATGNLMTGLWPFLSRSLDTASRTTNANYTQAIDVWGGPPSAYVHLLQADAELERTVNREVLAAFGRELVIDWSAAPSVGFRVGSAPKRSVEDDRVSEAYAKALREMPRLDEDGDGIKSFVGCVLATYCGSQPVLMIDEPEAFLHPPQARRLGAALARAAREKGRQVVIATHSADIVQGAINADGKVAVCRLTREGDKNRASLLDSAQLASTWSKPIVRSAAAIDGLFHVGAVVCEADADVRLYSAALRRAEEKGRVENVDFYFAQGGGKGELPTLARAYGSLETKTAVIADIDLLRNSSELRNVLEALGGAFDPQDPRYRAVLEGLRNAPPIVTIEEAAEEINTAVAEFLDSKKITGQHKVRISRALQDSSTFGAAKRNGVSVLSDELRLLAEELLVEWRAAGLFLVPCGELESWWPAGPRDKSEWINAAVAQLSAGDGLVELEEFVCDLAGFLNGEARCDASTG